MFGFAPNAAQAAASDLDFSQHLQFPASSLKSEEGNQLKTNTWPLRPANQATVQHTRAADSQNLFLPATPGFANPSGDLEFKQYVHAVQRNRQARAATGSGLTFDSFAEKPDKTDNPWSAGDGTLAWPPFALSDDR